MATIERLKKIREHAENGIGEEKKVAQKLLDSLLKKKGLSVEDLDKPEKFYFIFEYRDELEKDLLWQIIGMVTDCSRPEAYKPKNRRNARAFMLTETEHLEIDWLYSQYLTAFREEQKILFRAFIMKNRIFALSGNVRNFDSLTEEEREKLKRATYMASAVETVNIRKQINGF